MIRLRINGYAKIKREMNQLITTLLKSRGEEGMPVERIFLLVDDGFGLGSLSVKRRLDLLESNGYIKQLNGIVKWIES